MADKITILDTQGGFFKGILYFFTKKDLKVEIEVLNRKLDFYKKVEKTFFKKAEKTFFKKAEDLILKYSKKEAIIQTLKIETENLKKELSKLKNKEEIENKKKKEKRNFYLKQLDKLTGKKRDLFELYHIKEVKDKSELLSELEITDTYYRQLKFMINKETGVKIGI